MKLIRFAICLVALGAISSASAQGTSQSNASARQGANRNAVRYPSATQPNNNNPFQNPIGQGVAPATNVNPARNNQVSVPAAGR
jgi:hypothetical protein